MTGTVTLNNVEYPVNILRDTGSAQKVASHITEVEEKPGFYLHEGILMRLFRPSHLAQEQDWADAFQIVIPSSLRSEIVSLAHDGLNGHLSIKKTYQKLQTHYFWPGMKKSVTEYIKSCHICQVIGKPNQSIPPAPLIPIPVLEEPFEKILIDCVGPLPSTCKGNKSILTIMCRSTRFPIAIPLKNISAKNIATNLIHTFSNFGIPKVLQSDQGTNFTSDLFREVLKELNVLTVNCSVYHPESQGALERFHQTLKSMLKCYCLECSNDWDEGLDFLLFAVRECKQESLGFSPFELLFGREIRGPLKIVKDHLLANDFDSESSKVNMQTYMNNLKERLSKVRKLAKECLKESQVSMKTHFDKSAKVRQFQPEDEVLVLMPIPGSPFSPKNKSHIPHRIVLSPERRKVMRDEVNFLLEHGLAEHSCSPWASPCLLAPKPGGCFRLCTDYRKLYDLTIPDSYPLPLIDAIIDSVGQAKREIQRFLSMCGFYRHFCPNFSTVAAPLTTLTSSNVLFKGTDGCEKAFHQLKAFLFSNSVLCTPSMDKPFLLYIDASDQGMGAVLMQRDVNFDTLHPVCYYSAKLKKHQKSYRTANEGLMAGLLDEGLIGYEIRFKTEKKNGRAEQTIKEGIAFDYGACGEVVRREGEVVRGKREVVRENARLSCGNEEIHRKQREIQGTVERVEEGFKMKMQENEERMEKRIEATMG
ncbi:uncharacterized protein [Palaemon carinicauda]|uniref:uncharacterized protein n=1 Tax=Palaemon carinicauda TaxID=392227 RepID=UPI0035B5C19C